MRPPAPPPPSVAVAVKVEVEKAEAERTKPMKFGDLDDIIRVAEYEIHELYYALRVEIRAILSDLESKIETLMLKDRATVGFGIVREIPPITSSLEKLEEEVRELQGPKLNEAKNKLIRFKDERLFILKKEETKSKKPL